MIQLSVERTDERNVLFRIGEVNNTNIELILSQFEASTLGELLLKAAIQECGESLTEPHKDGDPYAATMRRELRRERNVDEQRTL